MPALNRVRITPVWYWPGIGGRLLRYVIDAYAVSELTVNEQNPRAAAFYEHMGFEVCGRSERDEQGGPYPVLYMKRRKG